MPPHRGCNSHQQAQDRAAVITSSSISPAKEEQTGLLESRIHLATVSSINSSLCCLKIGAIPRLQPAFRIPRCQAQRCMKHTTYREPQQQRWTFEKSSCKEVPSISECCGLGDALRQQQLSLHLWSHHWVMVASQELVATPGDGLPEGWCMRTTPTPIQADQSKG